MFGGVLLGALMLKKAIFNGLQIQEKQDKLREEQRDDDKTEVERARKRGQLETDATSATRISAIARGLDPASGSIKNRIQSFKDMRISDDNLARENVELRRSMRRKQSASLEKELFSTSFDSFLDLLDKVK